jgi:cytochrome c oxidase subunit 2
MDTLVPHSDLTTGVMDVYSLVFWWTLFLFIVVQGGLIYIVMRFKAKGEPTELPEQIHGHPTLEMAWTVAPVFILISFAIPTVQFIYKFQSPPSANAVKVNALGWQWWFSFEYPDLGVVTANEMHIPLGKEIIVRLQSDNVLHSFWVPQLAGKRDMVPGRVNMIKFTPNQVGMYLGQCAEYCGDSHALMKFRVFVDTPEDFEKWVADQKADAALEGEAKASGESVFNANCASCHTIRGNAMANGKQAPDLTHVGSRTTIGSGLLDNNTESLRRWLKDPQEVKPGSLMKLNKKLSDEEINTLIPYLQSLK